MGRDPRDAQLGKNPRVDQNLLILPGNASGFPQEELGSVIGEKDIWKAILSLLPSQNNGYMVVHIIV